MGQMAPGWEAPVRRLLRKLRRPSTLERDAVAHRLRAAYGCSTAREAVVLAIERGLHGRDPRLATILRRCDVEGDLTRTVASELRLSERQFFRCRAEAIGAVASEMARTFRAEETSRRPGRNEALRAYALGRYLHQRFEDGDCRAAIGWFLRAVAADGSLVEAWTGLAAALVSFALTGDPRASLALERARAAVRRAEALRPRSALVHAANAGLTLWQTRDSGRARALASAALERDDGTSHAHLVLGWTANVEGAFDAAQHHFARAATLDAQSFRALASEMTVPFFRGEHALAVTKARELLEIEPDCEFVLGYLTEALNASGRYRETVEVVRLRELRSSGAAAIVASYARALALSGDRERAIAVRRVFVGPAVARASIDLALGEPAAALDDLERAVGEDNGMLALVEHDPAFEALHDEPRFARIVAQYMRCAA